MKMKISEIEIDWDIYPRQSISVPTVKSYVEALNAGANFPPIEVQKVRIKADPEPLMKTICIDGGHRISAYNKYNEQKGVDPIEEVDIIHYDKAILDKDEWLEELRIVSALRNAQHGDRMDTDDLQYQVKRIAESNPNISQTDLAKRFDSIVSQPTIGKWIEDIRKGQDSARRTFIARQRLMGFEFKEVSDWLEILPMESIIGDQVSRVYQSFKSTYKTLMDSFKTGKTVPEIAKFYGITTIDPYNITDYDEALVWALILQEESDLDKFEIFGDGKYGNKSPKAFNVWNFVQTDPRLGKKHEMMIPGQIAMNVLYYFTEPGGLVVDPMAGGGSTIDACLVMGRKCRAYDLDPRRYDIAKRDITDGYDEKVIGKIDLVFLDPPYGDMVMFDDNTKFYEFMTMVATKTYDAVKADGIAAVVMCDRTKGDYDSFIAECYSIFKEVGFECIQRISAPLTTESASGAEVKFAIDNRKMLGRDRVVYIFRKV